MFFQFSSLTFKSDVNADVAACVIKEVKSLNPSFQTCDIRGQNETIVN